MLQRERCSERCYNLTHAYVLECNDKRLKLAQLLGLYILRSLSHLLAWRAPGLVVVGMQEDLWRGAVWSFKMMLSCRCAKYSDTTKSYINLIGSNPATDTKFSIVPKQN
jgi:hypothetical protein